MLCSRQKPLNASATADSLPDTHHEHPSRTAGSFFGQERSFRYAPIPTIHGAPRRSRKPTFLVRGPSSRP